MLQHNFRTKQTGVSFISILAFLVLLVFSLNFVVRIFGMHWDDRLLVSILDDLPEVLNKDSSVKDVRKLLNSRLSMNRLGIPTDELVITKHKGEITLVWPYERRDHVMSNVDIVLTFNHEYSY
ncbi:MAG: DUF4845 domain-containing protein [Oleispira antarctica]|uniref:DUF4845 domain-containing protein n=1 Tax=Oleispira antarctica RB-8 TaxID=698738 RepID=R4YLP4_OLEAN|nr:DUF4845 domain-containing protein [Oleispira antarctica]MBQ0792212.1 DUF4845 domain-containing protein [Oleispira antarctica]CCK75637.1 conserved hypothetical protein [Oleispira antarctica RB-8]|tara:strand:+ start:432 stop:800 length:369 start_codon:yes stop_codon:yes gene_type:complete